MRRQDPLIIGAGPAGCAAAIGLATGGRKPLIIDRDETPGDPLCGGFLSWRTAEQLRGLGVDVGALGAHKVSRLALFTPRGEAHVALPRAAFGLSRHALDTALRKRALACGAELACDVIRGLEPGQAIGKNRVWRAETLMLANGKEDVRGHSRPRASGDPALGLRIRLPATSERHRLMAGQIELHLFQGGYAGIVLQEEGSANVCLALRKSALTRAGSSPADLLAAIADVNEAFAARLGNDWQTARIETIGAVPYGYICQDTQTGLYRLGDQAAVIPSLAGEGIGLALASGTIAASHFLYGGVSAAQRFQQDFARAAARPVRIAKLVRTLAESPLASHGSLLAARLAPVLFSALADAARIDLPHSLAHPASPA